MFFICQYPPLVIKALWFNTLMADTAYNITHQPTSAIVYRIEHLYEKLLRKHV